MLRDPEYRHRDDERKEDRSQEGLNTKLMDADHSEHRQRRRPEGIDERLGGAGLTEQYECVVV